MFSRPSTFLASAIVLALSLQVNAHCQITPPLGASATPARSNVQRPSAAKPCGNVAISAQALDTATPVVADANGNMVVTATSFNGGTDGGRQLTMQVDPTGTGTKFQPVAIPAAANGVANPPGPGSQNITVNMGAIKCTGGKAGNLCLMAFTTNGKFGNCVVGQTSGAITPAAGAVTGNATVTAGGAAAGGGKKGKNGSAATAANATLGTSAGVVAVNGTAAGGKQAAKGKRTQLIPEVKTVAARSDRRAVGSRAARAYLMALE